MDLDWRRSAKWKEKRRDVGKGDRAGEKRLRGAGSSEVSWRECERGHGERESGRVGAHCPSTQGRKSPLKTIESSPNVQRTKSPCFGCLCFSWLESLAGSPLQSHMAGMEAPPGTHCSQNMAGVSPMHSSRSRAVQEGKLTPFYAWLGPILPLPPRCSSPCLVASALTGWSVFNMIWFNYLSAFFIKWLILSGIIS